MTHMLFAAAVILSIVLDQGGTSEQYTVPAHTTPAITFVSFGLTGNQPVSVTQNGTPLSVNQTNPDGSLFFTETGGGNFDVEQPPQQTGHTATLTWTDPNNPPGLATYNVYRQSGVCNGGFHQSPTFKIATGVPGFSYVDTTVTAGSYCYAVYALVNGTESAPSNIVHITIPVAAPVGLQIIVQ